MPADIPPHLLPIWQNRARLRLRLLIEGVGNCPGKHYGNCSDCAYLVSKRECLWFLQNEQAYMCEQELPDIW